MENDDESDDQRHEADDHLKQPLRDAQAAAAPLASRNLDRVDLLRRHDDVGRGALRFDDD